MNRISTRLAVSFMMVALLPTLPLSLVVRSLLERRFGPAIADPIEIALDAGLEESRAHLRELRDLLILQAEAPVAATTQHHLILLDAEGHPQSAQMLEDYLLDRDLLRDALATADQQDEAVPRVQRLGDTLLLQRKLADGTVRAWIKPLPEGMVDRAEDLTNGLTLVRTVRNEQDRVILGFVGPFLLVYGVLILVALAAGYFWSRRITGPLDLLVGATRRVGAGDLEFRIPHQGTGEVGELVASFDHMVSRLADQRRDLARLERAAAWRGMARTLAHEVKNPLTPILLSVNQVRDKYAGDDPEYRALLEEVAEIVGEEVESLRRLVKEFGDFARLPKPKLRPGDLGELLDDLQQLYGADRLALPEPGIAMTGWFDPEALRRALVNLIDNGLTACRQAGHPEKVTIAVRSVDPGLALEISDLGIGISAENQARIFEPDFTTKSDGMGLGLAIVEGIVIGHGGRITVQSTPGEGTTFALELPLTRPAENTQEEE
jgi:nitrogen fixation/metabolism regulation signal transduction histidine kinase